MTKDSKYFRQEDIDKVSLVIMASPPSTKRGGRKIQPAPNYNMDLTITKNDDSGNPITREESILTFDNICLRKCEYFSFHNGISNKIIGEFQFGSKEVKLDFGEKNNWGVLFEKFSIWSNYKSLASKCMTKVTNYFVNDFPKYAEDNDLIDSTTMTVCNGPFVRDGKVHIFTPDNSTLDMIGNAQYENFISDREIMDTNINEQDVIRWLENIKKIPLNEKSKATWYRTLALSFSSYLRAVMFDCGVKSIPYVVLIGPKGEGKSSIYIELLVNAIHNIPQSKTEEYFKGSPARLRDILSGSTRPQTIDEVSKLEAPTLISLLKNGATNKFGFKLPRLDKNMTMTTMDLIRNIFIGTNKLEISDVAFYDRMLEIYIPNLHRGNHMDISHDEIVSMRDTGPMIGKILDEIILKIDMNEIKEIIRKTKDEKNPRLGDKKAFIKVGIEIIKKIYKKYGIEYDKEMEQCAMDITNQPASLIVNTSNEQLLSALYRTLRDTKFRRGQIETSALSMLRQVKDDIDNGREVQNKMALSFFGDYGIYFKKDKTDFGIIIGGKQYKSLINNLLYEDKISSLRELSTKLDDCALKNDYFSSKNPDSTKFVTVWGLDKQISNVLLIPYKDLTKKDVEVMEEDNQKRESVDIPILTDKKNIS